jgi:uncharacterized protein (TIGR02001 family)
MVEFARRIRICGIRRGGAAARTYLLRAAIGAVASAATGLGPPPAIAQTPAAPAASTFDVSLSGALTSDYNYRGYTLSDHQPSVSTNFEATYNIFFAAINTASVSMPMLSHFQMTNFAGIQPIFGPLTMEVGAEYYSYPGSDINIAYLEYYAAPTYAVNSKLTLGLNVYYAPDYSRTGAWENYNSVTAKYTFDSGFALSGELGRQSFGTTTPTADSPAIKLPDYTYWNFGVSYTYTALTLDLRYYATTLSKQSCYLITGTGQPDAGSNGCSPAIIGTMTWNANLSGVK